jgi:DNA-binding transcriptional LysR family regulator
MSGMELRHLEYFVAVAEERNFTRAARRVHVVQSGLSAAIQSFERELGVPLFVRTTRRVDLTDAGRALLPEARRTLAAADAARAAVAGVQGLLIGSVSIGTGKALGIDLLPVFKRFTELYPGVALSLHQAGTASLIDSVRDGRLDFAPLGFSRREPEGVATTILRREPVFFACGARHRLAGHEQVRIEDLAGEAFVDFERGWGIRLLTDDWFAKSGTERRVAFTVNDMGTLLDLVGGGLGVAIVPGSVAVQGARGVQYVPFAKGAPDWRVGIVVSTERPLGFAAKKLLEMVVEAAAEPSGA